MPATNVPERKLEQMSEQPIPDLPDCSYDAPIAIGDAKPSALANLEPCLPNIDFSNLKTKVVAWYVMVVPPKMPERSTGGILLTHDSIKYRSLQATFGKVVGVGSLAWSVSRGYPADYPDEEKAEVGDWVIYPEGAGVPTYVAGGDGEMVLVRIMQEREIVCKTADPSKWMVMR